MGQHDAQPLCDRFHAALQLLTTRVPETYQGWIKACMCHTPALLAQIDLYLRNLLLPRVAGKHWDISGWVPIGVDGTKINLPRTAANEKAFGVSGKNNGGPQAYLTLLQHLPTRLPFAWKLGKAMADERSHLRQMLYKLPRKTLLVADAGFVGFDLWNTIHDAGHGFIIRAGANVRLIRLGAHKVRRHENLVWLWPQKAQSQGKKPLVLRCIEVHDGRRSMCLLTNVLDEKSLPQAQVRQLYHWRWGVELWFRSFKQTLANHTLRSKAPVQAALELRWRVLGLAMLQIVAVKGQIESGGDPERLSVASAVRVIRAMMRDMGHRCRPDHLRKLLIRAMTDLYQRRSSKQARGWPCQRKRESPGVPKITEVNTLQLQLAQRLCTNIANT